MMKRAIFTLRRQSSADVPLSGVQERSEAELVKRVGCSEGVCDCVCVGGSWRRDGGGGG